MGGTGPSIIIIVLDTLRLDTAQLHEKFFIENGFQVIENVYSTNPWTAPTHASLFTGLYPIEHGVHINKEKTYDIYRIPAKYKPFMLNAVLEKKHNYQTLLFSANPYITPLFGYDNFNKIHISKKSLGLYYDISFDEKREINTILKEYDSYSKKLIAVTKSYIKKGKCMQLLQWYVSLFVTRILSKFYLFRKLHSIITNFPRDKGVNEIKNKIFMTKFDAPFFLFINLMEPHEPYDLTNQFKQLRNDNLKTGKIDDERIIKWRKKYEEYSKRLIEKTLNLLKEINKKTETISIITSDHGQLFGENNRIGHKLFLYDELLRIPFYIKSPSNIPIINNNNKNKSIVNLKKMILASLETKQINITDLTSDIIFAESYGVFEEIPTGTPEEENQIKLLDKYRIRALTQKNDIIFNVTEFKYENQDQEEIQKQVNLNTQKKIMQFLRKIK